jgi:hypothetical protein
MAEPNPSTTETWRPVVGFEGLYEVSDLGRVRNIKRRNGTSVGLILRQNPNGIGYAALGLRRDGKSFAGRVHMLVAAAFMGPAPEGCEVNHLDGDKMNPRLDNLEYVTHTENVRHAIGAGLHNPSRPGSRNGSARLTEDTVRAIRREYGHGQSYASLARTFGVGKSTVARVVTREDWSHVQ